MNEQDAKEWNEKVIPNEAVLIDVITLSAVHAYESAHVYVKFAGLPGMVSLPFSKLSIAHQSQVIHDAIDSLAEENDPSDFHKKQCDLMIADGWQLGSEYDVESRRSPYLMPYDELPAPVRAVPDVFFSTLRGMVQMGPALFLRRPMRERALSALSGVWSLKTDNRLADWEVVQSNEHYPGMCKIYDDIIGGNVTFDMFVRRAEEKGGRYFDNYDAVLADALAVGICSAVTSLATDASGIRAEFVRVERLDGADA